MCTGVGLVVRVVGGGLVFNGSLANLMQHVFVMGAT